jgi:hypothetical protein
MAASHSGSSKVKQSTNVCILLKGNFFALCSVKDVRSDSYKKGPKLCQPAMKKKNLI